MTVSAMAVRRPDLSGPARCLRHDHALAFFDVAAHDLRVRVIVQSDRHVDRHGPAVAQHIDLRRPWFCAGRRAGLIVTSALTGRASGSATASATSARAARHTAATEAEKSW